MSLIHLVVIRIHFCPWELAGVFRAGRQTDSVLFRELSKSDFRRAVGAEWAETP